MFNWFWFLSLGLLCLAAAYGCYAFGSAWGRRYARRRARRQLLERRNYLQNGPGVNTWLEIIARAHLHESRHPARYEGWETERMASDSMRYTEEIEKDEELRREFSCWLEGHHG